MVESFGKAGVIQIVRKFWVETVCMLHRPIVDGDGDFLEGIQMSSGISFPPVVIRDHGFTLLQQAYESLSWLHHG